MSDSSNSDPRARTSVQDAGVLANLPRTRPQRASPRRARTQPATPRRAPATTQPVAPRPSPATTTRKAPVKRAGKPKPAVRAGKPKPAVESVPAQGYEAEEDSLSGPVRPPGSAELVTSAAELAGELAKTGVTTGARLVRDLLSRLPG